MRRRCQAVNYRHFGAATGKENRNVSVQLNHTIVWCRDKEKSATFFTEVFGLPSATPFGPMLVVPLNNDVSIDFYENDGEISSQHYAFLISEEEFDQIFARVRDQEPSVLGRSYRNAPAKSAGTTADRGIYFEDPTAIF
jgi:catechol 2,3-dioxygenase-like lactoylglutathione lyase family enzyme